MGGCRRGFIIAVGKGPCLFRKQGCHLTEYLGWRHAFSANEAAISFLYVRSIYKNIPMAIYYHGDIYIFYIFFFNQADKGAIPSDFQDPSSSTNGRP